MSKCAKCGSDHDDPQVNRKLAERAFTLIAVIGVLDAMRGARVVEDTEKRLPLVLIGVAAFVGLNLGTVTCIVQTLGMAKIAELVAADKDPRVWIEEQSAGVHGDIDLSDVLLRNAAARDIN